MNKKGFTIVELLATIVIAAIIITIAVSGFNGISGKLKQNSYENKVSLIENAAANYGDEKGGNAVFVDTLVKEGYLDPDNEDGDVIDPRDEETKMNCYVVNINFDKDNIYGKYSNEEIKAPDGTCDTDKLETKYLVVDLKLYEITNAEGTEWNKTSLGIGLWTKKDVMLIAEIKEEMKNKVSKITFISTIEEEERIVAKDYNNKNKKKISAIEIMNTRYIVEVETKETGENGEEIVNTYRAQIKVKIDKQRPVIYDGEIKVEKEDEWTNQSKKIKIVASDGEGSGIYGFSISEERDCNKAGYKVSSSNNDTYEIEAEKNGKYYICAKDKVGNVSEEISSKVIEINNIDKTPPKCVWSGENTTWTANDVTITLTGEDESGSDSIIKKSYKEGATKTDNLKFVISDKAGNETVCEKTVNVYVDKVVPTKPKIEASDGIESGKWHKSDHTLNYSGGTNLSGNTYKYGTSPNPTTIGSSTLMNTNTTGTTYYVKVCSGTGLCSEDSTYVEKLDKVVPPAPTISASDGLGSGIWHNKDFTISYSGANNISGNQYFYDTKKPPAKLGTSTRISSNSTSANGTRYYVQVCSGAGLCSGYSEYVAKLDKVVPPAPTISASDGLGSGAWHKSNHNLNYGGGTNVSGNNYKYGTSPNPTTIGSSTAMNTNTAGTTYYVQSCSGAGLCSGNSTYVEKLDKVVPAAPTITASDRKGSGTWHNRSFNLNYGGASNISGNIYFYGTTSNTPNSGTSTIISSNTSGTTYYAQVCSIAGHCSSKSTYVVKLDTIAPTCSITGEGTNWVNERTITYGCVDSLSGCTSSSGSNTIYNTTIKTTTSPQYTITDNAGNQTTCSSRNINVYVDRTEPDISFSSDNIEWSNVKGYFNQSMLTYSDIHSGIKQIRYCKNEYNRDKDCGIYTGGEVRTDWYQMKFYATDNVGNVTEKYGYVKYDKNPPYTPFISGACIDNNGLCGATVNVSCSAQYTFDDVTCTINPSSLNNILYYIWHMDGPATYESGQSGPYAREIINYYGNGTTCRDYYNFGNEQLSCDQANITKSEVYDYDKAGNKSNKLTFNINWP